MQKRDMLCDEVSSIRVYSLGTVDRDVAASLVNVYRATFSQPPYLRGDDDVRDFAESLNRHATFAGFRAVVARTEPGASVVGFAYGYTVAPGQWWFEQIATLLSPDPCSTPLTGAFLLTQLAVVPAYQGCRLGSRLHDALLAAIPHARAVLSTREGDSPARHLYRRRGWTVMLQGVMFPGAGHPYQVLVRESPPESTALSHVNPGDQDDHGLTDA